jgi:modulator of FtsH protease
MTYTEQCVVTRSTPLSQVNQVLKKTYLLLSLTLLFSGLTAGWAMHIQAPPINPFLTILGYFGLLFLTTHLKQSRWGLVSIFALTGFLGYTLGPILTMYLKTFINGNQLILMAFGSTGTIFLMLSIYALLTRKDFSYLNGFLFVGIWVAFLAGILAMVFHWPLMNILVSMAFVLLSAGYILFQTSIIIHRGEQNYILATIGLYVAIFNLFISLLQIFGAFAGNRR